MTFPKSHTNATAIYLILKLSLVAIYGITILAVEIYGITLLAVVKGEYIFDKGVHSKLSTTTIAPCEHHGQK